MSVELNGPRLDPEVGSAKRLVVFLHGYGADGNDLIELGKQWRKLLPDAAFVSPHAPERCAGAPTGRQWFALNVLAPEDARGGDERWRGVVAARPALDAFLDAELARLGLDEFPPRPRRLQPGIDDGAARRPAPPPRARRRSSLIRACWSGRTNSVKPKRATRGASRRRSCSSTATRIR